MAVDGKGRPTKEQARQQKVLADWLDAISAYEKEFKPWEGRVEKIVKRYRDDRREGDTSQARFNILWSNVQTLRPATFSKLPQPDVARRFRDNDPVGRVASLMLERALEFEISHYPDYRATLNQSVTDRFLGGRGTAWARYEPHIRAVKQDIPEDGVQVTEDVDEPDAPGEEELEYECAPIDYVHWRDFGHSVARTWEEVTKVWRRVYMTRDACIERFGDELGKKIPLDSRPEDLKKSGDTQEDSASRALVYEGWDKETGTAVWISKSMKQTLDEKEDPLGLEGFFPCPQPLYATITNDSLIPVPDFTLYQDQAKELDILSDRIDGLVKALQVKGCYDASIPEIARLFTEGTNADMIPVKNWGGFAEKQGLAGAISLVDLKPIAEALREAYTAMEQVKHQVYEITGISDIIRGATQASETATAQQIKGKYATLRLKAYQDEVAVFATQCLRLKAQIMCGKFDPATLVKISAADQLSPEDQQLVPQAVQLLFGDRATDPDADLGHYENPVRSFRIDIAADTLVQTDEEEEKNSRMEFLRAIGAFLKEAVPAGQQSPQLVPLMMTMLKFGVTGFKVGKTIEGAFDEAESKLKEAAANPQATPPDPAIMQAQAQQQSEQARIQHEGQVAQMKQQGEEQKLQAENQREQMRIQADQQAKQAELAHAAQVEQMKVQAAAAQAQSQQQFDKWKAELEASTKIVIAQISADTAMKQTAAAGIQQAEQAAQTEVKQDTGIEQMKPLMDMHGEALQAIKGVMEQMARPKSVVRDAEGRVSGVQ